jgi:phytoene dehydrogenase-like protein
VLEDGSEIQAAAVVSNADPRRTFLDLVDPVELDPSFTTKIRNYRCPGTVAKINLALSGLPEFRGIVNPADLHGRIHIGPSIDYLERAFDASKYGAISPEPYLDMAVPTLNDPSLAPPGKHVLSIHMQFAPYKLADGQDWETARGSLFTSVMRTLEVHAPGIEALVEHRQVITPVDLERTYGLTGGHIFHGEPSLDQFYAMRPIAGWAQYRTPIAGLFLCGAGTHPGGGITGGPGQNAAREILRHLT